MPLLKVASLQQLPPGAVTEVVHGEAVYALCNVDGDIRCLDGTCPHAGGPLGQGTLNGATLVCPWHGWEFNAQTGVNDFDDDVQVKTFPVVVRDDEILIDVS